MKFTKSIRLVLVTLLGLLAGTSLAFARNTDVAKTDQTALSTGQKIISQGRYIETRARRKHKHPHKRKARKHKKHKKSKKRKTIAQIRDKAIKDTISDLSELRPYTRNYNGLKAAVRRYWRAHVRHPSASGLAGTIMRYVKRGDRKLVRADVYSGSRSGVKKVKRQLEKRK